MGYSLKLKIDSKRPRKDGTSAIYLQVIINRKKRNIGLEITWPPNKFHVEKGCLPRMKDDPDVDTYNIVIGNAKTKANNIRKEYLIKDRHLTIDTFLKEYHSNLNKNDFVKYFEKKSFERWKDGLISDHTYDLERVTLNHLQAFAEVLPFHQFNSKWAPQWDKFLKRKYKNDTNTRWGKHKHVTTYLIMARDEDKIAFDDPYSKFVNSPVEGKWGPIDLDKLKKLISMYSQWKDNPLPLLPRKNGINQQDDREGLTAQEVIVLRKFLFACNSALRISDMQKLDESKFTDGEMTIMPHKTERYGTNIKSVPLNDIAKQMLRDEIEEIKILRRDKPMIRIFERYVDQYCNRLLKRIALKAKWNINLHMHVARYTYGSLMDEAGANHTALMKLMGIRKRETLEKYVKTNKARINNEVQKMNDMIATPNTHVIPVKPDVSI